MEERLALFALNGLVLNRAAKRRTLEIVLSNCTLDGVTLCPTIRKPFDVLAEGLLSELSGGGGNRTRVPQYFHARFYVCSRLFNLATALPSRRDFAVASPEHF